MEKESILKAKQQSNTKELEKAKELARTYIRNKATHYVEIVRETGNYWRGFNAEGAARAIPSNRTGERVQPTAA